VSNVVLWLDLETETGAYSRNLVLFGRPKQMDLLVPAFERDLSDNGDGSFALKLATDAVALWTWLELSESDAVFSDSFFSLCPGTERTIRIEPRKPMTLAEIKAQLVVKSLVDTYRE
jgi:beta-mannosidase